MSDAQFTIENIKKSSLQGYQLKAVAASAKGFSHGFSLPFDALIDPGAYHTCISKTIMDGILDEVFDMHGNQLQQAGKSNTLGVYGNVNQEPVYILPHFYFDESLKNQKQLIDNIEPFSDVFQFAEFSGPTSDSNDTTS